MTEAQPALQPNASVVESSLWPWFDVYVDLRFWIRVPTYITIEMECDDSSRVSQSAASICKGTLKRHCLMVILLDLFDRFAQ